MVKVTHVGVGAHTRCVGEKIHELTQLKFRKDRESEAGIMLKPTQLSCLELEVVDQGIKPANWRVSRNMMIINSEQPSELKAILSELGFKETKKGSLIFVHRMHTGTPRLKLVEGTSANWHIGIHFDCVPTLKDLKNQHPILATIAGTEVAKLRSRQHGCIKSAPLHGLQIEITSGTHGFIGHGPARSDLVKKGLTEWSPYGSNSR